MVNCPTCSWEPKHGKKRSHGLKSDDDGFEIVPIEDPGEPCTFVKGEAMGSFGVGNGALTCPFFSSETSDTRP